ncbi:(-)-drimenol synthase-like [Silene latifolia]|uniref:(-)-drimenol synthase-like n=1 Tax=Silene latifolia TaxID=37657 RepID=UPI003D775D0A
MANQSSTNQVSRPIAGFHPCHWGDHFLNLTHHDEEILVEKEQEIYQLKVEVSKLLAAAQEPLVQLTFIDTLERLGVSYHFEEEIEQALELAYERFHGDCENADLNHVSLRFRIFRQHGFHVPCDVFNKFKDENERFKESLTSDVQGMLSLYEASYVRVDDDKILDDALAFTTPHLIAMSNNLSSPLADLVPHALHQPLHLGIPRVEARFYISIYEKDPSHNQLVLQFAKVDFNFVQSLHQRELKELKRYSV